MNLILTKGEKILLMVIIAITVFMYGVMGNTVSLKFNDWKMPVLSNTEFNTNTHFSFNLDNKPSFWVFSDIIDLGNTIYSIGDLIMLQGLVTIPSLFAVYLYIKIKEARQNEKQQTRENNQNEVLNVQ